MSENIIVARNWSDLYKLLLLLLLLFTAIDFSLGGSSPYNSNK